jgi:mono/diheme cytochrome c family protein
LHTSRLAWLFTPLVIFAIAAASSGSVSFTASQMQKGERQFAQSCATCHGEQLEGGAGPALTGPNFKILSKKVGARVGDVFTYMSTNMPLNEPASLSHDQYVNIMAFILSKNSYKPGKSPLTYTKAENSKAPIMK